VKKNIYISIFVFLLVNTVVLGTSPFEVVTDNQVETITEIQEKEFPVTGTVEAPKNLRMRSWPWGKVVGSFKNKTNLKVTGVSGDFYEVEVNGQKGYMHKNFVSIPGAPASCKNPNYPSRKTKLGGYLPKTEVVVKKEEPREVGDIEDIKKQISEIEEKYDKALLELYIVNKVMTSRFLLPVEENHLTNEAILTKYKIEQIEKKYDQLKIDLEIAKLNKGSELTVKEIQKQMMKLRKDYKIAVTNLVDAKMNLNQATSDKESKRLSAEIVSAKHEIKDIEAKYNVLKVQLKDAQQKELSKKYSATLAEAALAEYKGGKLTPAEFARLFGPIARENMKKTGVPASVTMAQAALETGWGSSSISDAKNLFGIKGNGPAGTVKVPTKEFLNGRMVTIKDYFRKYNTWQESIEDHGKFLQMKRYKPALKYANNPDRYAQEIHKAGYATDPNYADKLIKIMKSNNFYQYDV
jgi:flagellum-specific peptidoglycan hydrolase FlgJ